MRHVAIPFTRNSLLASLPDAEIRALEPKLDYCRLAPRMTLHETGDPLRHVFFPVSGVVSLLRTDESGASTELAMVGREGMIGLEPFLGRETAANQAVVQAVGRAYRLRLADARAAFAEGGKFQTFVLRFAQRQLREVEQMAVCKLHHLVEQQLCRWLLLFLDRVEGDDIHMTHELIASLLGVRRQGVTEAAHRLQARSIISYSRGRIAVLERAALEASACGCYELLRQHDEVCAR